ncbi:UNVERIFIED_CONTAM: hypothetical protein RMT77_007991 [Armadillidium vulgare]
MELKSGLIRRNVTKSVIWKHKNAIDKTHIQNKLEKQLTSDIFCLFENSKFVDLKLESLEGFIYSHRVIVAGRFPSCWSLLNEINRIQLLKLQRQRDPPDTILTVSLPKINLRDIKVFIRSLYTNRVDEIAGISFKIKLEEQLVNLKQSLFESQKLYLERLNLEEERELQELLLHQLRKGEISEEKGNLRDVSHLVPTSLKCSSLSLCSSAGGRVTRGKRRKKRNGLNSNSSQIPIKEGRNSSSFIGTCEKLDQYNMNSEISAGNKSLDSHDLIREGERASKTVSSVLESYPVSSSKSTTTTTSSDEEPVTQFFNRSLSTPANNSLSYTINDNEASDALVNSSSSNSGKGVKAKIKRFIGLKKKAPSAESVMTNNNPCRARSTSEQSSVVNENIKVSSSVYSLQDDSERLSDIDPNGLHETSSLEVELPSSHGDQSLSPDSVKSEENVTDDQESNKRAESAEDNDTHKPLVRTRTFDLIEPTCTSLYLQEDNNNDNVLEDRSQSTDFSKGTITSQSEEDSENFGLKNTTEDNPDKLREIERKKGSLLFEHSIQTFSNIPTTNIMSVSMTSERGVGMTPLYSNMMNSSMLNSFHSVSGNGNHCQITNFPFEPNTLRGANVSHTMSPLHLNTVQGNIHNTKNDLSDTQSPSPDSLCVEPTASDRNETISLSKEDLDFEEKEKDEKEDASKSISNSPPQELDIDVNVISEKCPESQRLDKPIVSGGLFNWKENVKNSKDIIHPRITQRQFSTGSVKDVDSIPLVCGYVSDDVVEEKKLANADQESLSLQQDDEHQKQQNQSMFSMFINFKEIPSPEKDVSQQPKTKTQPTGGMYMFIEAESTPSPKTKRRSKPDNENKRNTNTDSKHDSNENIEEKHTLLENTLISVEKEKLQSSDKNLNDKEICKTNKDKKGFFVFIEADELSKTNSPKPKRRANVQRKTSKKESNVMSKSAPGGCLLLTKDESSKSSNTESSNKLMTKSVIDREEFMAQPPTRRNVSLNDKINESSKIPRPVPNFKEKLLLENPPKTSKELKSFTKKINTNRPSDPEVVKSLEGSYSEAATSLSVSFSEMASSLPPDVEDASEFSDVSSLLSSIDRSNNEPSSEQDAKESLSSLGDDLLKMFVNEINTDVVIQIGERKIKAHKCILASRCVYFAAMLSGHWVESAGNVIKLQGFSPESVVVALKHIYSGSSTVPEDVKVGELAALADMLALDGLKEVVAQNLKANMCHYFHKPCADCVNGVLEVLPIAGAFCLEELYHKCLKWISKHFAVVMPTRNFASLPSELQDRCLKQIMDDMSISNVIESALGGDKILSLLPVVRWAQPIFDLTAQLLESVTNFIANNLSGVLSSDRFLELGRDGGWNGDSLEDTLKMACDLVRPDEAVLAHIQLTKLTEAGQDGDGKELSENYLRMLERLLKQIEKFIIHNANRVAVCRKWPLLPSETQKRIKDAALVVIEFSKPLAPRPKFSSANRVRSRGNSFEPVQRLRTSSMTDHRLSRSASANVVPPKQGSATNVKKVQQQVNGRCHTPPPSVIRASLQTPPPTRASTLRAQARQAAIQRSQSARAVVEKPKKLKSAVNSTTSSATDNDSQGNSNKSATYTRSRTSSQSSFQNFSGTSRSSTPGLSDRVGKHKRNASGPQLIVAKSVVTTDDDEESFQRWAFVGQERLTDNNVNSEPKQMTPAQTVEGVKNPRSFSIGASPLHLQNHHLRSVQETPPRGPRKPFTPSRGVNNKGLHHRPSFGRRVRSPLRTGTNVSSNAGGSPMGCFIPKVQNISTKESEKEAPIIVGLGSRSNTFCKDDGGSNHSASASASDQMEQEY